MKLITVIFCLMFLNISFAADHEGGFHTANFCTTSQTCAHLRFEKYPTTAEMSEFLIHVLPSKDSNTIESLTAKLWMDMGHGHGHGSAPLAITVGEEENHFAVTNAWFVMAGTWQVIVNFKENGTDQQIIIPVDIKE